MIGAVSPGRDVVDLGRIRGCHATAVARVTDPLRVFLVDDHELLRRGLSDLLADDPGIEVVGEAGSLREALSRIPAARPHVVLLDVRLPDGSGVDICRCLRDSMPEVVVVVLTAYDEDDGARIAAEEAGASGFLLKQIKGEELVALVHRAARGESLFDAAAIGRAPARRPARSDPLGGLTGQERRVLGLLVEGLSNRKIGNRLGIGENTVKNYVTSILAKLGLESRTQAAVFGARLRVPDTTSGPEPIALTRSDQSW